MNAGFKVPATSCLASPYQTIPHLTKPHQTSPNPT